MTSQIITIPCLSDNYAFLLHDNGVTALIDAPEAASVQAALEARGWTLDMVLLTHHHWDHVEGLEELRTAYNPKVVGSAADAHRLPALDIALDEGETVQVGATIGTVIDVSGHTINHIAYHFPQAVFTGDSLMAMGCGRVFEGDMDMMWTSLSKLAALPADTVIYSGHEYTLANAKFAMTVDGDNPALQARLAKIINMRDHHEATVPSTLTEELATNPFLRAQDATDFARIRTLKDNF